MDKKELQVIKETELRCREILSEAEEASKDLILKARKEADKRYRKMIHETTGQGEALLTNVEAEGLNQRNHLMKELRREMEAIHRRRDTAMEEASNIIFERMWMCGNCKNV